LARGTLAVDVGHTESSPHDQLRQAERREERTEHLGCLFERGRVEHLAPDVRVHAQEFDAGQQLEGGDRFGRGSRRDRESELRVLLTRSHEFMGVRLDAGGHAHQRTRPS